jgi:hypothetical protein
MQLYRIHRWFALAALPLIGGCAFQGIYSEHPLGDEVAVLKPAEWEGVWVADNQGYGRWFVTDADKGMLARRLTKDRLCDARLVEKAVQLRQFGPWYFARGKDSPDKDGFYESERAWFRLGDALVDYQVDARRVRDLVEQGVLPGRIEKDRVILGTLTPVHYRILFLPDRPAVRWHPLNVYVKLPAELDPCKAPAQSK